MRKDIKTLYYPRKMRTGWCVAHEVTAAGVTIERYGVKCRTYAEAFDRADRMNRQQLEAAGDGSSAAGGTAGTSETPSRVTDGRKTPEGGGRA